MEYYKPLQNWLRTNGTYETGVELYTVLGKDDYLKNVLFKRRESNFIYEKLRGELEKILKELKPVMEVPIVKENALVKKPIIEKLDKKHEYSGVSVDEFFNLPQELQKARLEIGQCYAEVVRMRRIIKRELNLPAAKGTITLQEAFYQMSQVTKDKKGIPFEMTWVTYNSDTGEGGEMLTHDCILKFGNKTGSKYKTITPKESDRRDPRHDIHGTVNIQIANTIELRKLHTWLIFRVNGWDVVIGEGG